jgi:hypothetical protein
MASTSEDCLLEHHIRAKEPCVTLIEDPCSVKSTHIRECVFEWPAGDRARHHHHWLSGRPATPASVHCR